MATRFFSGEKGRREADALMALAGGRVLLEEPMSLHTSLRVGGVADAYLVVSDELRLAAAIGYASQNQIPVMVMGRGTNLLVADQGIRGLVIENRSAALKVKSQEGYIHLLVGAGASLSWLARLSVDEGWEGLEWAVGIPGTVGGAVINNSGAYGFCMADLVEGARLLDGSGEMRWADPSELGLGYRTSRLRQEKDSALLAAQLRLKLSQREYLTQKAKSYMDHRRRTQPREPSAGSTFRNPKGDFAGRLIETVGLKGWNFGGAQISAVHANFVVNSGGATAWDVWNAIRAAQKAVLENFGVELQLEIELVGEWPPDVQEEAYGR